LQKVDRLLRRCTSFFAGRLSESLFLFTLLGVGRRSWCQHCSYHTCSYYIDWINANHLSDTLTRWSAGDDAASSSL